MLFLLKCLLVSAVTVAIGTAGYFVLFLPVAKWIEKKLKK